MFSRKQDYKRKILHFEWKHVALANWIAYRLLTLDTIRNLDYSLTKLIVYVILDIEDTRKITECINTHIHRTKEEKSREQPQVVLL